MFRRLLIAFLLLIVVAVVAVDRVGEHVAAHVLAGQLQSDEHLQQKPDVSIAGIPFLTQVFGGKYHDVAVTARDFKTSDGVTVTTLKVHLHDAHIPFSKVLSGSVKKVPVARVDGTAYVSFGDLGRYLSGTGVSVRLERAGPHSVSVSGTSSLGGHPIPLNGVATVAVSHSVVSFSLSVTKRLKQLVLSVPLRGLPFRINLTSVTVGGDGITAAGNAKRVTLGGNP
ncbi:MAG TPA: DUF2993 domain-containing protein [Mycobacteriales bacterium]|nr:DUF2993 domain-containing protein [Mycobacteriales bacterium]